MHEYSLATELVNALTEKVSNSDLKQTRIVHVRLGKLRILSQQALVTAYQMVTEQTSLAGSKLEFEEVSVKVCCKNCGYSGKVDYEDDPSLHYSIPVLSCPDCGGPVEIEKGRELEIHSLTLNDERSN